MAAAFDNLKLSPHVPTNGNKWRGCLPILLLIVLSSPTLFADEFTYIDETGAAITSSARLIGAGQGFDALERRDGQIQIVPAGAIQMRENTGDPEPYTPEEMAALLRERFSEELTRIEINGPFVVGLVLAAPLESTSETKAATFLHKASRFMKNVDDVFMKYARSMQFPLRELRFPLVLLIFESDEDFNEYATEATGGQGLAARSILGFYSVLTNWLAVRMSSCDSFAVPLHEAIHLQMYNRVFSRLAPIPKWFDEGIATGFEGEGEKVNVSPSRINPRYGQRATRLSGNLEWGNLIANDTAFTADVLAGEAYTLAWSLHWMLATRYTEKYRDYVRELSRREPLAVEDSKSRVEHFEQTFGVSVAQLQQEFPRTLLLQARRQRIDLSRQSPLGRATNQQALGEYDLQAIQRADLGGRLHVEGVLQNISPLRTMTFYVTVETESGFYADWLIPDLKPGARQRLAPQVAQKAIPGTLVGSSSRFRVYIRSTPANSKTAEEWKGGDLPGPVGNS